MLGFKPLGVRRQARGFRKGATLAKARQTADVSEATAPRQGEVGRLLRETREKQRQDLRAMSDALRIRYAHLLAIEEGRYGDLPGATYAVGFVRAYAEHLRLDSAEIVRRFKDESAIEATNDLAFPTPVNDGGLPSGALIVVALLLAGGVYGAWHLMSGSDRSVAEMIQDVPERLTALLPTRGEEAPEAAVVVEAVPEPVAETAPGGEQRFLDDETVATTLAADAASNAPAAPPAVADTTAAPQGAPAEPPAAAPAETVAVMADEPPPPADAPAVHPPETVADADPELAPDAEPEPELETVDGAPAAVEPAPATAEAEAPRAVVEQVAQAAREPVPTPMPTAADNRAAPPPPALQDAALPAEGRTFGEENADARVILRARADAWVQVRDGQGLLMTRLLKRGDSYRLPNRDGLTLMTGNAGGLVIEVDGVAVPALGHTGEVRRDVSLDVARLKAAAERPN